MFTILPKVMNDGPGRSIAWCLASVLSTMVVVAESRMAVNTGLIGLALVLLAIHAPELLSRFDPEAE